MQLTSFSSFMHLKVIGIKKSLLISDPIASHYARYKGMIQFKAVQE